MNGTVGLLRAVSAAFMQSLIRKFGLVALVIWSLLVVLSVLLMLQIDAWWGLLLIPLVLFGVVAGLLAAVLWFATQQLAPRKISGSERKEIKAFSDKVMGMAERVKTPLPVLAAGVAKDIIFKRDSNVVRELINDSTSLKTDFQALLQKYS